MPPTTCHLGHAARDLPLRRRSLALPGDLNPRALQHDRTAPCERASQLEGLGSRGVAGGRGLCDRVVFFLYRSTERVGLVRVGCKSTICSRLSLSLSASSVDSREP
ncbi:hypothetical protein KC354_g165 [Hortaea werneckii]|nr:hypothetical protein KC354_g165 [Hortaea werneckii]